MDPLASNVAYGDTHQVEVVWRPGLAPRKLQAALEFVHRHLGSPLPLNAIAAAAGVSPYHFARLFRQSTGVSPHHYVTKLRVERAKYLLRATRMSIAQVAFDCGFGSQSYLTTVFGRHVGVTPRAFRITA